MPVYTRNSFKPIKVQGGDVKLALISNLHIFLANLNITAKNYHNMHLKALNNFYKKGMSKILPPKTQEAKK